MIKSVEIENFQSHKHSSIELHPGVNIIKGTSHEGKSSIVRALKWVLQNRPDGTAFMSRWMGRGDSCKVTVGFSEGTHITREKTKSKNVYHIPEQGELAAIGRDVPEEVKELSIMSEDNIQSQHDGFFLLQESSGNVAKKFNQVTGLQIIDEVVTKINSIASRAKIKAKVLEDNIAKTEERIQKLKALDELEGTISNLEKRFKKRVQILNKMNKAVDIYNQAMRCQRQIDRYGKVIVLEEELLEVEALNHEAKSLRSRLILANFVKDNIEVEKSQIEKLSKFLPLEEEVTTLEKIAYRRGLTASRVKKYRSLYDDIRKADSAYFALQSKLYVLIERQKQIHIEIKICPLCEQPLPAAKRLINT